MAKKSRFSEQQIAFVLKQAEDEATVDARNMAPLFCGRPMRLALAREADACLLWAEDELGQVMVQITARSS